MQEGSFQHGALDGTRGYHHIISHPHILIITIITLSFYYLSLPPHFFFLFGHTAKSDIDTPFLPR